MPTKALGISLACFFGIGSSFVGAGCAAESGEGNRPGLGKSSGAGGAAGSMDRGTSGGAGAERDAGSGGSIGPIIQIGDGGEVTAPRPPRMIDGCPDCAFKTCPAGADTTISGTVHTPAKVAPDPLFNAVVYVPSTAVEPFSQGVACDKCGNVSGKPVAATLSGPDGKFKLEGVPAGHNVPIVLQLGRWRRQVRIPEIKPCADNALDPDLTRFARNRTEGDIPFTALATSYYDPVECILRKIGIEDSEVTLPGRGGRIEMYAAGGASLGPGTPAGDALFSDLAKLKQYDMVLLPCLATPERNGSQDPAQARHNVVDYAAVGGRLFITDLSHTWIKDAPEFTATAQWSPDNLYLPETLPVTIDTTFPKGDALATWLQNLGATTTKGSLTITEPYRRTEAALPPAQRWLYSTNPSPSTLQQFTFNTPVGASSDDQCGRVFFSSFHIAEGNSVRADPGSLFPVECPDRPLTPQERVLEFMLFDLASCVQIDMAPPQPPPVVR